MKKVSITIIIILILSILTSGCLDIFSSDNGSITYQSHPTKISYEINYGYIINCSGTGEYSIKYNCDLPELINGDIFSIIPKDYDYEEKTLATYNNVYQWNVEGSDNNNYNLGITAILESESYLISDLTGSNALDIKEIKEKYPDQINQYCKEQSNDTAVLINPNDIEISSLANSIKSASGTNNSFIIAKELFVWLKQHTSYKIHISNLVQPAYFTFQCKTGDCDDLSFLYISLCRSVGIPSRFIKGFLIEDGKAISHAWVEVFVGEDIGKNGWIPVECAGNSGEIKTEINQNFGVESAKHLRIFTDDGSNESVNTSLSTLYFIRYSPDLEITSESYAKINSFIELESKELVIDENDFRFYQ